MTKLLEQAMERARQLPADAQDEIAQVILQEMESERQWDDLFTRDPEKLKKLSDEALAEHRAGKTEALDADQL